jgi:hypothetical protein
MLWDHGDRRGRIEADALAAARERRTTEMDEKE